MVNTLLLIAHVGAGTIGICSGMTALFARKGTRFHKRCGQVFFYSMMIMAGSATYIALGQPFKTNIIVGLLTMYLVLTARRTLTNRTGKSGMFEQMAFLIALAIFSLGVKYCIDTYSLKVDTENGLSVIEYFLFFYTGMAGLCMFLDVGIIIRGQILGARRMARHIWRMCFALWIAAGSLFLGQPQVFPEVIRDPIILSVPVIFVLLMLFYWLIRVYVTSRFKIKRSIDNGGKSSSIELLKSDENLSTIKA